MRQSVRATTWTCDRCETVQVLTDSYQDAPPEGWRIIHVLPQMLNMALQPGDPNAVKVLVLCTKCFTEFDEQTTRKDGPTA